MNQKRTPYKFPTLVFATWLSICITAEAEDWTRFLGKDGKATSSDADLPTEWDDASNIKWKTELPGPGSSSPIVSGDHVFITCYTGYGTGEGGEIGNLARHLFCLDRNDGKVLWKKSTDNAAVKNEDPYKSFITQHGYATNTPVTDGKSVYAFFGKPGLVAYDFHGTELWRKPIESSVNETRFGSGASPILYGDQLIVNAVEECGKIYSLAKSDGKTIWEYDTKSTLAYATPNLVKTGDGEMELVVAIPNKVIGLDPKNGKLKWFTTNDLDNEVNGSVMVEDDIVYVYGGFRKVGSTAIRSGGEGDVTKTHVLWNSRDTSYVATPVYKDKHIYWITGSGIANCVNAETGERLYRKRLPGVRGGRGDIKFFASMVIAGDNLFALSRQSGTFVLKTQREYELVAQNIIKGDDSEFNGTPAISNNQMFIRSNKYLYCIAK